MYNDGDDEIDENQIQIRLPEIKKKRQSISDKIMATLSPQRIKTPQKQAPSSENLNNEKEIV